MGGFTHRGSLSDHSGGWNSKAKVSAESVSPETTLLGWQMAAFPTCVCLLIFPFKDTSHSESWPAQMNSCYLDHFSFCVCVWSVCACAHVFICMQVYVHMYVCGGLRLVSGVSLVNILLTDSAG